MNDTEQELWSWLTCHPNFVFWLGTNFDYIKLKYGVVCSNAIVSAGDDEALVWIRQNIKHQFSASNFYNFFFSNQEEALLFKLTWA
jgi:hypothetical protein